jgi:hypothetical protein
MIGVPIGAGKCSAKWPDWLCAGRVGCLQCSLDHTLDHRSGRVAERRFCGPKIRWTGLGGQGPYMANRNAVGTLPGPRLDQKINDPSDCLDHLKI